jgi:outer membrane immunogenic protein
MKKLLVVSIAAAAFSGASALAADMPVKAAPAPMFNWTGFYIGGQGGYGWGSSEIIAPTSTVDLHPRTSGGFWGGYLGYNFQFSPNWVIGAEADLNKSRIEGTFDLAGAGNFLSTHMDSFESVRGRIGYAINQTLFFATVGWYWADTYNRQQFAGLDGHGFATLSGWTVGGGVEYAFSPNWIGRIEYRHLSRDWASPPFTTGFTARSYSMDLNAVSIGLAYKFGDWSKSSVVAKY